MLNDGKNTKFLIVLIFSLFLALSGCKSSQKVPKEVREAEKAEMEMENEIQKEYEFAIKNHNKMQSDQSKKIMKDQKKATKRFNKTKKRSLWDRIFNKNCQ